MSLTPSTSSGRDGAGRPQHPDTQELARSIAHFALAKKGEELVILDLRGLSPIADFFVLATGLSDAHVRSIADGVRDGLMDAKPPVKPWHLEGYDTLRWVLLDYVHVVVHVFQRSTREYYGLERFWGDAPREAVLDEPPSRAGGGA